MPKERAACSVPGCNKMAMADLKLTLRQLLPDGTTRVNIARVVNHVYLCQDHWPDMDDFLTTVRGGDNGEEN